MTKTTFRINNKYKGYILVSCAMGHSVRCINAGSNFGGSMDEADLGRMNFNCQTCEERGAALAKIEAKP